METSLGRFLFAVAWLLVAVVFTWGLLWVMNFLPWSVQLAILFVAFFCVAWIVK